MGEHYDVIVIGSAPGGASLAQRLAPTGKRILILERGTHEIDILCVADASFFPAVGAVNPTLTIIAKALRVTDIIKGRL